MRKPTTILVALVSVLLAVAPSAQANFGLKDLDVTFTNQDGSPAMQAGSHPFAMRTSFAVNTREEGGIAVIDGAIRNLDIFQAAGFAGDPTAVPRCQKADFLDFNGKGCADSTAVGTILVTLAGGLGIPGTFGPLPVYSLPPGPGSAAKLGFVVSEVPVMIDLGVNPEPPYNVTAKLANTSQPLEFLSSETTVWGNPADPAHDSLRGHCAITEAEDLCPAGIAVKPFITMPRSCTGPLKTLFRATSWWSGEALNPGPPQSFEGEAESHDNAEPPSPLGTTGCDKLGFAPTITAKPTSKAANSPTGLDFSLDVKDEGLGNPEGIAHADIEKAVVTLPEGFSVNPSIAEGLNVCTQADLARESAFSEAGAGCPEASKIGTVEVETPLLEENVNGALYQAAPYDNPFGSLIALYIVIKNPTLGVIVKQPVKVIPDPVTGRLTTVAKDLPQLPFSHFRLHFREGARSPLATPPACGTYSAEATLYPSSGGAPVTTTSAFQIISGPDAGPCPAGGLPPFHPGLVAGTLNNAAGRFSPFNVRLFRSDSEQEITHFSIKLPPGITGKLAGIPSCSDAAIAAAKARTGPHGGQEELESPSCPQASEIGHTLAGSGVGPSLAYAPGELYLAGPYHGSQLSLVSITAAKVGPFDLGTVVVRLAFKIDPETAEVFIDATGSDPIPHIIQGVPVHLRDIRAYTDRPQFVLNPTSCKRTSTASTLLGSGLDFGSEADDRPITVSTPFQAADCAALPFKPRLSLQLKGGTKRGDNPAFKATLRMNGIGEAGIARAQVTLPRSEFIDNEHFNTICTRVQFKEGAVPGERCPPGSIYGYARAITPILADPLEGPIFLRSSEHQLPDVVASLHNGQINVVLDGRVDSVKGKLRNTFEATPDAPVTSVVFELLGGKKGLFENSTNLCAHTHKAIADFTGQNGKEHDFNPMLKAKCPIGHSGHKRQRGQR
jgi:hypothetical protein